MNVSKGRCASVGRRAVFGVEQPFGGRLRSLAELALLAGNVSRFGFAEADFPCELSPRRRLSAEPIGHCREQWAHPV